MVYNEVRKDVYFCGSGLFCNVQLYQILGIQYNASFFFWRKFHCLSNYRNESDTDEISFERNLRDPQSNPNYVFWFYSVCYLITHFLIPFCIIILLNCRVSREIIKVYKHRKDLTRKV